MVAAFVFSVSVSFQGKLETQGTQGRLENQIFTTWGYEVSQSTVLQDLLEPLDGVHHGGHPLGEGLHGNIPDLGEKCSQPASEPLIGSLPTRFRSSFPLLSLPVDESSWLKMVKKLFRKMVWERQA